MVEFPLTLLLNPSPSPIGEGLSLFKCNEGSVMSDEYLLPDLVGDPEEAVNLIIHSLFGAGHVNKTMEGRVAAVFKRAMLTYFGEIPNTNSALARCPDGVVVQFIPGDSVAKVGGQWIVVGEDIPLSNEAMCKMGDKYGFAKWQVIGTVA